MSYAAYRDFIVSAIAQNYPWGNTTTQTSSAITCNSSYTYCYCTSLACAETAKVLPPKGWFWNSFYLPLSFSDCPALNSWTARREFYRDRSTFLDCMLIKRLFSVTLLSCNKHILAHTVSWIKFFPCHLLPQWEVILLLFFHSPLCVGPMFLNS